MKSQCQSFNCCKEAECSCECDQTLRLCALHYLKTHQISQGNHKLIDIEESVNRKKEFIIGLYEKLTTSEKEIFVNAKIRIAEIKYQVKIMIQMIKSLKSNLTNFSANEDLVYDNEINQLKEKLNCFQNNFSKHFDRNIDINDDKAISDSKSVVIPKVLEDKPDNYSINDDKANSDSKSDFVPQVLEDKSDKCSIGDNVFSFFFIMNESNKMIIPIENATVAKFSKNSKELLIGTSDGKILTWDLLDNVNKRTILAHEGAVNCIAISKNGDYLISGSEDKSIKVYNNELLFTLIGHYKGVTSVVVTEDNKFIISASEDAKIICWNFSLKQLEFILAEHQQKITSISLSSCEKFLISGSFDKFIIVWDLSKRMSINKVATSGGKVLSVGFPQNTLYGYAGTAEGSILLFHLEQNPELMVLNGHRSWVTCLLEHKNFIISGSNDGFIRLWDLKNINNAKFKYRLEEWTSKIICISLSNDSKRLARIIDQNFIVVNSF